MGMQQHLMAMPVAVLFVKQQHHTGGHQSRGQHQRERDRLPQNRQGKQGPDERCGGEQHRLATGAETALRQQIQPDRDAITQGTNRQQFEGHR